MLFIRIVSLTMDDVYKRDLKANEHIYYIESPIQI